MKKILFPALCFFLLNSSHSQDVHFSQYHPILLNPGATGSGDGLFRGSLSYKTQWASMGNPYRTLLACFDLPLLRERKSRGYFGTGAYFFSDKAGDSKLGTNFSALTLSGIVPLNDRNTIATGFSVGYGQRSASLADLQWPSQYNGQVYDPGISPGADYLFSSFSFFDISTGIYYQFLNKGGNMQGKDIVRINAGAAYFHITRPSQNFYSPTTDPFHGKFILNALMRYDIPETKIGICPTFIFSVQGPAREISAGGSVRYKLSEGTKITGFKTETAISGGVMYRIGDSITPLLLLELTRFDIGISYDVTISSLSKATKNSGGFEISLRYSIKGQ